MSPFGPSPAATASGSKPFAAADQDPTRSILFFSHDDARAAAPQPSQVTQDDATALFRQWEPIAARLGLAPLHAYGAAHRAVLNRTSVVRELLASGQVDEHRLYRAIADELGLRFISAVAPERLLMDVGARMAALQNPNGRTLVTMVDEAGLTVHVLAHTGLDIAALRAYVERWPEVRKRLRVTPPSALRAAIVARSRENLSFQAQYEHFLNAPDLSARFVLTGQQGLWVGAALAVFALCLITGLNATLLALQLIATVAFLSCILLRAAALGAARPIRFAQLPDVDPAGLPVYSVIVPLYRERELVPQILIALGRLHWPRSKLEIKIVCEADDAETLAALRAHRLHSSVEIVEVPPGLPRTKPKALAYALPLCSGELVTLYDAEDRPHPSQLIAAWRIFSKEDENLACLQAPLVITNDSASALSRMFAFEYAGLFRGLLPYLARGGLLLPLGGTSNHFRRPALVKVGGWDPFNVTEDADLGLRLARAGYRIGVLQHPTYEDGPETLRVWMPQRVRWFKGWMQTWLVHMRDPLLLWRQLGPASFLAMQILFAGMIASALVHPIFLATIATATVTIVKNGRASDAEALNAMMGLLAIVTGYGVFISLSWKTMARPEKASLATVVLLTPLHWLLLSAAAWRALGEIYLRPHHWNKTPHRRTRRRPVQASTAEGAPMMA